MSRDSARSHLGQASWVGRRFASRRRLSDLRRARAGAILPPLPAASRGSAGLWAVMLARNEVDIIGEVVRHVFEQEIDHLLVLDHGSVDGTSDLLADLTSQYPGLHVGQDTEPAHIQSEKTTWLAHLAWRHGASWILPIDADEFWFADQGRTLGGALRDCDISVAHATWHHMVPAGSPDAITVDTEFQLDAAGDTIGKVAARSHPLLEVQTGNHAVSRVGRVGAPGLHIAHALYRSRDQVARKFRQGGAAIALASDDIKAKNGRWLNAAQLSDAEFDAIWDNISSGGADPRIEFEPVGPVVRVRPLGWQTWDPDGVVATARMG